MTQNHHPDSRPAPHPVQLYRQVWRLAHELSFNTGALRNWGYWCHRFDDEIHSVADAIRCSNIMLADLKDSYAEVRSAQASDEREFREEAQPCVSASMLKQTGIAHINVLTFNNEHVVGELAAALEEMPAYTRGIIIDLRHNSGGLLLATNRCTSLLMDHGPTMRKVQRQEGATFLIEDIWHLESNRFSRRRIVGNLMHEQFCDRLPDLSRNLPIAVLIGPHTASSAEMFAAILSENGYAELIGLQTFGKGILQHREELLFGATLDLTTGRFFSPRGHWFGDAKQTCAYGVCPDIVAKYFPIAAAEQWIHEVNSRYGYPAA